jgi:hypothetical protein
MAGFADYVGKGQAPAPTQEEPKSSGFGGYVKQQASTEEAPAATEQPKETNWAGTGPKQSFGEYMKSGFAGRFISGAVKDDQATMKEADDNIIKKYGAAVKQSPAEYKRLFSEEYKGLKTKQAAVEEEEHKKHPTPTVAESLKGFAEEAWKHPWQAAKGMVYELGKDPELIFAGPVGGTAKAVEAAGAVGKTIVGAGKAAAIGATAETAAQIGEGKKMDWQAVKNTAAMFGTLGGVMHGAGEGFKAFKEGKKAETKLPEGDISTKKTFEDAKQETQKQLNLFTEEEMKLHTSSEAASDILEPHAGKTYVQVIKDTMRNIRADNWLANVFSKQIEKAIPDQSIRERVTMALEGDKSYDKIYTDEEKATTLRDMEGASEAMKRRLDTDRFANEAERDAYKERWNKLNIVMERLKTLPSEEHAIPVMETIKARLQEIGKQALDMGLLDGLRRNYVTHMLDFTDNVLNREETRALMERIFSAPKDSKLVKDFTQTRVYETIRELEDVVRGTGIKVQKDIAKVMEAYEKSMKASIAHQQMIDHFLRTNIDGLPMMTRDTELGVKNKYKTFDGAGSKPLEGIMVHPELVDAVNHIFRQNDPNLVLRGLGGVSFLTKSLNTVASLFHAYNLLIARMTAAPLAGLKEIFSAGYGTREAVKHFTEGVGQYPTELALRNGLLATTEDIKPTIIHDAGIFVDKMLSKFGPQVKLVQLATTPFDKYVLQKVNYATWDFMHTGGKLHLFNHFFAKIKAKNPHLTDDQVAKEVASFVNNTLGGLDWLEVADQVKNKYARAFAMKASGIEGRDWAQIMMFAPDWTVSTLRAVTTALPKELSKPKNWELRKGVEGFFNPETQGDMARRYVFNTAVSWLVLLNGINYALSGHPIWENKDPTRVELGDGTSIQLAKHSMEAAEWVQDPEKTLGNKLGFWPKAVVTMTTGKAYPSPQAPMVKDNTALGRSLHVLESALPFSVGSATQAPPGERLKRAAMSSLGIPIYGQTKQQYTSKEVLKERALKRLESQKKKMEEKRKGKQ